MKDKAIRHGRGDREVRRAGRTRWSRSRHWPATRSTTCRACRASVIKTAAQLINEYGDLETLLEQASEEIKQPKRRQNLIEFAEHGTDFSRQLVTLLKRRRSGGGRHRGLRAAPAGTGGPARLPWSSYEFRSVLRRLADQLGEGDGRGGAASIGRDRREGQVRAGAATSRRWKRWMAAATDKRGVLAVDTETTSLDAMARRAGRRLAVHRRRARPATSRSPTRAPGKVTASLDLRRTAAS